MITSNSLAPVLPLERTIQELSCRVLAAQGQLDTDYAKRLDEFAAVTHLAAGTGFEALAKSAQPAPMVMSEAEIECSFVFGHSVEHEFAIRILNASWVSRFQSASSAKHSLRLLVKRAPLLPAKANGGTNSNLKEN